VTLSTKMKEALERLFRCSGGRDYVQSRTAYALKRRGLADVDGNPAPRTNRAESGSFPHYRMSLTVGGHRWCAEHYKKLGAT
jgi:hypothetical protein